MEWPPKYRSATSSNFSETFRNQRLRYFIKFYPLFLVAILFSAVMFARKNQPYGESKSSN